MNVREALNHMLASPLFARFEAALQHNSIFDVLAVGTREVSHAAFLRWLMNPQEGHGAGDVPLRLFLMRAASKASPEGGAVSPLDVDLLDFDGASAECEVHVTGMVNGKDTPGRLDILVTLPGGDGSTQPLLIVEHKVYAEQSGQQTEVYKEWASKNPLNQPHLDGARQPLLAYVCPDITLQSAPPVEPFIVIEYADLSAWLDDVLAHAGVSERARFLINEYKACLIRRDLFDNPQARERQEELESDKQCSEAIKTLKASPTELRGFDGHVNRHAKAFKRLGIVLSRVASRGDAATVVRLRELAEPVFAGGDWGIQGGTGSLTVYYKPLGRSVRDAFGEAELNRLGKPYLQFYFTRPENEIGVLDLYGGIVGGDGEDRKPMQAWVKEFCGILRERVLKNLDNKAKRGNGVAKVRFSFAGIKDTADDVAEAVHEHEAELRKCLSVMEALKAVIEQWGATELKPSIQNNFPGVAQK
ncbi:MAG: PD-(D/E)XK nuclease family protein [Planctomycetota bacterium]|nr:PD-(D/E)XK nuclease family protein [Planctomycetota bacterium]